MEKKNSIFSKIIGFIFIIWFVGSIISLFIFQKYAVMIFGQYFFVFGLIPLFQAEKFEKLISIPFLLIGLGCIIIPFLMMHPEILNAEINWDYIIVLCLLSCFIIAGLCMIIIPIIRHKRLKEKCSITVSATITDYLTNYDSEHGTIYCPVYEFEFNKKKYQVNNNMYSNFNLQPKGTVIDLKINPDNPEEFLDNESVSTLAIILGIIFLIVTIPITIYVIISKPI